MAQDEICIPLKGCLDSTTPEGPRKWEIVEQFGDPGAFGEIWLACCSQDCEYVLKYQRYGKKVSSSGVYSSTITSNDFYNELKIQKALVLAGIAPRVVDWWECGTEDDGGGAMIMEAMNETVFSLLKRYDRSVLVDIIKECINIVDKMHQLGYYHGDLHLKNIMVRDANPGKGDYYSHNYRYYLIDFGLSGYLTSKNMDLADKDFQTLLLRVSESVKLTKEESAFLKRYIDSMSP